MTKNIVNNMKGIISVLNTPFTENNHIDINSIRKNVNIALESGVIGFLVPAMAGEVNNLTEKERIELVSVVIDETGGKVPVIGCASADNNNERLKIGKKLIDLGCKGVLVNIPFNSERQYKKEVQKVADLNPGFLMLQDWDFSGYGIPISLIKKLYKEIDIFQCLKIEVVPAGVKYSEVLKATEGGLHISGGWAVMQFIEALDRGIDAFMPTGMHEIYTKIYSLYQKGKRHKAQELFNRLLPILAFSNQHLDISIHFFKRLLYKQEIYSTSKVRKPILPFDMYHKRIADELIKKVQKITEEIK